MRHHFFLVPFCHESRLRLFFSSSIIAFAFCQASFAQVMKTEEKTVQRILPDEPGFKNDTEYKKKFEEIKGQLEELRKTSENAQNTLKVASKNEGVSTQGPALKADGVFPHIWTKLAMKIKLLKCINNKS